MAAAMEAPAPRASAPPRGKAARPRAGAKGRRAGGARQHAACAQEAKALAQHRAEANAENQCHPTKLFIGGLSRETTTHQLREHFCGFGPITDAVVLRWPDGRSRGFGYVTFSCPAAASAALSRTHALGGRAVDVKRAVPGTNKLFVGGLPQSTTAEELRAYFETLGPISDAVVMIDPTTGRSRGFGFVCFRPGHEGAAAVSAALARYDSHRLRGKWVEVKSAAPPRELAAQEKEAGGVVSAALQPPPPTTSQVPSAFGPSGNRCQMHERGSLAVDGRPPATPLQLAALAREASPEIPFGEPLKVSLAAEHSVGLGQAPGSVFGVPPGLLRWGGRGGPGCPPAPGGPWSRERTRLPSAAGSSSAGSGCGEAPWQSMRAPSSASTAYDTPNVSPPAEVADDVPIGPDLSACLGVAAELGAQLGEDESAAMEKVYSESLRTGLRELLFRCLPPEGPRKICHSATPPTTDAVSSSSHTDDLDEPVKESC